MIIHPIDDTDIPFDELVVLFNKYPDQVKDMRARMLDLKKYAKEYRPPLGSDLTAKEVQTNHQEWIAENAQDIDRIKC